MWIKTLDNYEVSDDGRIRNASTKREIKQFVGKDGYVRTQIAGKTRLVHRVIANAYLPEDSERPFVNHRDGNKQNNRVDNLEWVTRAENVQHAYDNNLYPSRSGINNSRCKLTEDQVAFIRDHYIPGDKTYGAKSLSKKFGVAHQTVCAVASGQNWNTENGEKVDGVN